MGIKDLLLQRGWAGKTISRPETVDRLNPLLRTMNELMQVLGALSTSLSDQDQKTRIEEALRVLRMDIGKVCETVFSAGGKAYSGTDLKASDFASSVPADVTRLESALAEHLAAERKVEHQMRTRAILGVLDENQKSRKNALRNLG